MVVLILTPRRLYICARCLQDAGVKTRNALEPEVNLMCGRCNHPLNYNMDSTFLQTGQFTVEDSVEQTPVLHLAGGSTIPLQYHSVDIPLITKEHWEQFATAPTESMRNWLQSADPQTARLVLAVLYALRAHLEIEPEELPRWQT